MKHNIKKLIASIGRPPVYDSKHHPKRFVELSAQGETIISISLDFCVSREAVYGWIREHKEFAIAAEIGRKVAIQHYHDMQVQAMTDKNMNLKAITDFVSRYFNKTFPEFFTDQTLADKAKTVQKMVEKEELSYDLAEKWIDMLSKSALLEEKTETAKIIEKLEQVIANKTTDL